MNGRRLCAALNRGDSLEFMGMGSLMGQMEYSKPRVMVVPYPAQGHINPMLQFAKRLVSKNVMVTFVMTEASREDIFQAQDASISSQELQFETISDGLPLDFDRSKDFEMTMQMFRKMGVLSLINLIERLDAQGNNICCIIYDSFLPWVPEVANKFDIPLAFFWTQSCAVYSIYYHFSRGLTIPVDGAGKTMDEIEIPGLPWLNVSELPSFLQPSNSYAFLLRLVMDQFDPLSEAKWVLGNSFEEIESEEINSVKSIAPIRTVGPLLPSAFLDAQNTSDTEYGAHLWKAAKCMDWLNTKEPASVVYVSFGSFGVLSKEQIHEIALGLKASGCSFIWVIRPPNSEECLPEDFLYETSEQGLVVPWCSQLEVLSHASAAAFMTHCGWNSTLESLTLGVPILAVPQWTDQTTNSKYIAEKWKTGLRLHKRRADGLVGKEEVEKCIKMIMETEVGVELRENALRWKTLSREAMMEGGSSDKNIEEFVQEILGKEWRS
eukprot:PITA_20937